MNIADELIQAQLEGVELPMNFHVTRGEKDNARPRGTMAGEYTKPAHAGSGKMRPAGAAVGWSNHDDAEEAGRNVRHSAPWRTDRPDTPEERGEKADRMTLASKRSHPRDRMAALGREHKRATDAIAKMHRTVMGR